MSKNTKIKKQVIKTVAVKNNSKGFFANINFGESYASLFLGIVVVVVAFILVFSFLKTKATHKGEIGQTSSATVTDQMISGKDEVKTYTVKKGDDLWHIAEKIYGSGYNWVDLAKANKLENPSVLFADTKLIVPSIEAKAVKEDNVKVVTTEQNPITGVAYTIAKGDDLWHIAVRAYGDGYKWVDIARANNLTNPNIINVGNVLKLPR
jgi:nucleoid-associated protein YgaU